MILKLRGRTNSYEQKVKELVFQMNDGSLLRLTRNITEYVIDHGNFEMKWRGVHTYTNNKYKQLESDFMIQAKWFKDAKIVDIVYADDAPRNYEFIVDSWVAVEQ